MKSLKDNIIFVAILCIFVVNFSAQIVIQVPTNEIENPTLVCGFIESEQLTIPTYSFRITDQNGNIVKNLLPKGELIVTEGVWTGNWFYNANAYWKSVYHNIKIPILYDSEKEIYTSQEISKIKIVKRKQRGKEKCLDRISELRFRFYLNEADYRKDEEFNKNFNYFYFTFHFNNTKLDKIRLPNPNEIINLSRKLPN